MDKGKLKSRLEDVRKRLVASEDAAERERLVDELLSLKGQLDVVPSLVEIPMSDVMVEQKFGSARLVKTRKYIVHHMIGGVFTLVSPRARTLYQSLDKLMRMKERYAMLSEDEKKYHDGLFLGLTTALTLPSYITSDEEFFFDVTEFIMNRTARLYEYLMSRPLQEETVQADIDFFNMLTNVDEAAKIVKEEGLLGAGGVEFKTEDGDDGDGVERKHD